VLAFQVSWSETIEGLLSHEKHIDLQPALRQIESTLGMLADLVLADQPTVRRRKLEHLVWIFSSRFSIEMKIYLDY
jgi:hypothetical protein